MQMIYAALCVLIVAFATDRAHGQQFAGAVPPFRPVPGFSNRRQLLTPVQQTHILSDVQQHQHRFAFPPAPNQVDSQQHLQQQQLQQPQQQHQRPSKSYQPNKSPNFQLEAAISKQLPTQTTIVNQPRQQQHFQQPQQQQHHHHHHHPQQQQQQFVQQQQQPLQSQNNFRTVAPGAPVPTEQHHVQHHTQTNFIPNYAQQQQQPQQPHQQQQHHHQQQPQQQQQPQPHRAQQSFNSPFAGPQPTQQLSQQYHQQPLNQRSIQSSPYAQQQQLIAQQKPFQPSIPYVEPAAGAVSDEQRIVFAPQQQPQPSARPQPVQTAQQIQQFQQQGVFQQPQQQQFQGQFTQQQQQQPQFYNPVAPEDDERIREKQKIIQKHEQFVQKQYQKQQSRVKQQHEEFLSKQRQIKDQSPSQQYQHQVQQQYNVRGRPVQPFEADAFQRAVKVFQDAHPTTAAPTTTTSTTTTTTTTPRPTKRQQQHRSQSNQRRPADLNDEDLEQYLKTHRQKLYGELRQEVDSHKSPKKSKQIKSTKALGKDDLLKQLKLALAENPQQELGNRTYDSMDIVLPDGQKVQVIRTTDPKLVPERLVRPAPTTTSTENPQQFYQQLAHGSLLPTGANFEVIRQSADGQVQTVDQLPASPQKKVTFVYLEEQNDGSFKVQGVKSNGDKEAKTSGAEVDSIVSRIQNGDIKLPPSSARAAPASVTASVGTTASTTTTPRPSPSPSTHVTASSPYYSSQQPSSSSAGPSSPSSIAPQVHYASSPSPYSTLVTRDDDNTIHLASASSSHYPSSTPQSVTVNGVSSFQPSAYNSSPRSTIFESSTPRSSSSSQQQQYDSSPSTVAPPVFDSPAPPLQHQQQQQFEQHQYPSSTAQPLSSPHAYHHSASVHTPIAYQPTSPAPVSPTAAYTAAETVQYTPDADTTYFQTSPTTPASIVATAASTEAPASELSLILKGRGLHAMSKYLRQSGLDSILNETGPYTVFAPTDKAFKNLLVQLGGPERAEEKFRSNPRLLSGLLLHHVIPGSFQISTLQDEMTGVSLAGTQLRVNQYNLHDTEWNDITITTINGAMVVPEKNDITIPQGIAHAVDRVMFPLPVGDILQTLQSDREHRFSNFLKALTTSGLAELLQNKDAGAKTYTVFAPVDGAFTNSTEEELNQLLGDKDEATKFVMRHVSSGTLFSAGMRFYQVRDALNGANPITIQKTNNGKIKINEAQIMTPNIPTTNGVIHAIDALL